MPPGCHCLSGEDGLFSVIFPQLDLEGALLTPVLQHPPWYLHLCCVNLRFFPKRKNTSPSLNFGHVTRFGQ